jgi:hypothetical protein
MAFANPPPHQKIPAEFLKNPATRGFFERLNFNMFQLWKRTGGSIDLVMENNSVTSASVVLASVNQLRAVIDGLPELTIDTTGFTIDTTYITTDKVIA